MADFHVNFGIRAHDIEANDIHTLFSKIHDLGIECIQLALMRSFPDLIKGTGVFNPGLANEIKKQLVKNQIRVAVLGCYINPVASDESVRRAQLELFKEHIKFAKYIGADMIGTETGSFGTIEENRSEKVYQILLEGLRELVDYAEKLGVMIGIEPHAMYPIYDSRTAKRMLDDLNSPNVSIILDPVNILDQNNYKNQNEVMKEAFELLGDKIAVIHLKDLVFDENGNKIEKFACEGILETKTLLMLLKQHKPYIDVMLETVTAEHLDRVRSNVMKEMAAITD